MIFPQFFVSGSSLPYFFLDPGYYRKKTHQKVRYFRCFGKFQMNLDSNSLQSIITLERLSTHFGLPLGTVLRKIAVPSSSNLVQQNHASVSFASTPDFIEAVPQGKDRFFKAEKRLFSGFLENQGNCPQIGAFFAP